jgi:hypothetical protein
MRVMAYGGEYERQLMPAQPGWMLRGYSGPEDETFTFSWPETIIAWVLDLQVIGLPKDDPLTPRLTVWPVLASGNVIDDHYVLVAPSGEVTVPEDADFADLEQAEVYLRQRWEKKLVNVVAG